MSVYTDRVENARSLPITYSINIRTSSISRRPLTCYITTSPSKQIDSIRPTSTTLSKKSRSTIHLPVTYSTSIHLPCQPATIKPSSPMIVPSPIACHHYHHHHYYYHQRESSSARVKKQISPHSTSISSTRPATTSSTTTITSPDSSLSPGKKSPKNIFPSPPPSPPPLPSYSALVWNWFHHRSTKATSRPPPPSYRKGSQSDYSETCRPDSPSKRTLLFKFLATPPEKQSKSQQRRSCFTRKRFQSSSALPIQTNHYRE